MANSKIKIDVEINKVFKELNGISAFDKDIKSAEMLRNIIKDIANTQKIRSSEGKMNLLNQVKGLYTGGTDKNSKVAKDFQKSLSEMLTLLGKTMEEVRAKASNEIDRLTKEREKLGDYDKLNNKGKAKWNRLTKQISENNRIQEAYSGMRSANAYADESPARKAVMMANAYKKYFGTESSKNIDMLKMQGQYLSRSLNDLKSLDLTNPVIDVVKKFAPNVIENSIGSMMFGVGSHKRNSVFKEVFTSTNAYSEFVAGQKAMDPAVDDKTIYKRFLKDKDAKTSAKTELMKTKEGRQKLEEINKAGSVLLGAVTPVTAAIAGLSKVIIELGEQSIAAYENIQALQTQLGVVFSSQGEANSMFQKFADYAVVSPFGVNTMVQQGIQLKQSGVGGSELLDVMKRIGDISSGNQEKMKSISDVFSRVMASTTVTARDMRQLVNAGVPAYDALTKAIQEKPNGRNVSRSNIRSLLQSGKVTSEDFERMLKNLTDEGGMFYGATKVGAKTLKARKQNLSDIRELALASLGENIVKSGGTDGIKDSWYGKLLSFQENMWGVIKEWNDKGVMTRNIDQAHAKMESFSASEKILANNNISPELRQAILNSRSEYAYGDYIASAGAYFKSEERRITGDKVVLSKSEIKEIKNALSKFNTIENILNSGNTGLTYDELYESYFNGSQFYGLSKSDLESLKKNATTKEAIEKEKAKSGYEKYETENNVIRFAEALTRGSDSIRKFIEATDGATSVVTKEKQRYESTSIGSLIKSDKEYAEKQRMKDQMNAYTSIWNDKTKSNELTMFGRIGSDLSSKDLLVKSFGKNPNGLTMENYAKVVEYMASDYKRIALDANNLFEKDSSGKDTNRVSKSALEDWKTLGENIDVLKELVKNDNLNSKEKIDITESIRGMDRILDNDLEKMGKNGLELISKKYDELEKKILNINDENKREQYKQALNNTFSNITYDNKRQEAINKSGNPHLWAEALSKLTGIASNRVSTEGFMRNGEAKAFFKYRNELAPKNLTKSLISAMVSSNTMSLKQLSSDYLKNPSKDRRGNYVYDWGSTSLKLSEAAKTSDNAELRNANISALQDQINAINELTIGSMALGETAEEVKAGLDSMGVAFNYSLKKGSDGLLRFTDATMEAAEEMKRSLQIRASEAKLENIRQDYKSSKKEKLTDDSMRGYIANSLVSSGYDLEKLRTQSGIDEAVNDFVDPMKKTLAELSTGHYTDSLYKAGHIPINGTGYNRDMSFYDYLKKYDEKNFNALNLVKNKKSNINAKDLYENTRDYDSLLNSGLSEASKDIQESLKKAFDEYIKPRDTKTVYTLDIKSEKLREALGALKDNSGNNLLEAAKDSNKGATALNQGLKDLALRYGSSYGIEKENIETVFKELGFSIDKLVEVNKALVDQEKRTKVNNANAKGWVAFTANYASANNFTDGLRGVDRSIADGSYRHKVKKSDILRNYVNEVASLDPKNVKDVNKLVQSGDFNGVNPGDIQNLIKVAKAVKGSPNMAMALQDYDMMNHSQYGAILSDSRFVNNKYLEERRLQGKELGDYDKSPFLIEEWEKKLNNEVYGLNEFTSAKGRTDFVKNNLIDNYRDVEKVDVAEIQRDSGSKKIADGMTDILLKAKSTDYGGQVSPKLQEKLQNALDTGNTEEQFATLQEILKNLDETSLSKLANEVRKVGDAAALTDDKLSEVDKLKNGLGKAFKDTGIQAYSTTLKSIGKSAGDAFMNSKSFADVWKNAGAAMRGVLSGLMDQTSTLMMNAGLSMLTGPDKNIGMGLALIAASGLGSFVSGMLSASEDSSSKNNDEYERLQKLKDNMADLLAQARNDAEYYEKELKNKKAISTNMAYSTSVNDMILTPQGQFSTAPDDYIFAMKHPEDLTRGSAPVINFSVVNNSSSVETRSEQRRNNDGSIDFVTVIDDVVQQGIAQGRYNDAFSAMQSNQKGMQTYA